MARLLCVAVLAAAAVRVPVAGPAAAVAALPAPSGRADVLLTPASLTGVLATAGTTFTLDARVEPNGVQPDAAALYATFDARYLEVTAVAVADATDTEIYRAIDNAAGTAYYAAGRLGAPWPSSAFTLARVTFRVKATPPTALAVDLLPSSAGNRNATEVAAAGVSVLGAVRGAAVGFVAPTATPAATPAGTPVPTAAPASQAPAPAPAAPATGGQPAAPAPPPASQPATAVATVTPAAVSLAAVAPALPLAAGRPVVTDLPPGVVPPLPPGVRVAEAAVGGAFERFYAERQGIRVLGNTLAPPAVEQGVVVQYFEKGRIESHPQEPNPAWQIQYGLLVDELAGARVPLPVGGDSSTLTYGAIAVLARAEHRVAPPPGFAGGTAAMADGAVFVPFSAALQPGPGQLVPANFWAYINDEQLFPGGWLHDVGLPTTAPVEAVVDKGPHKGRRILVQAFQRTILTFDPVNPPDYTIERANVGTDYARVFAAKFGG